MSLDEILVSPLPRIINPDGDVLHAMKANDNGFADFGEAYFSWVNVGAVKAWKRHTRMVMNLIVPVGRIRFVFCSGELHKFRIEEVGVEKYARITVPAGIYFGFQAIADQPSLLLNIANIQHDPNEVERLAISEIKFDWKST